MKREDHTYRAESAGRALVGVVAGLGITITDGDELFVDVLETSLDGVLDGLGDLLLDETGSEGLEGLVEKIVLGLNNKLSISTTTQKLDERLNTYVANGELERVDFDVNVLDLEHAALIATSTSEVNLDSQSLTTKEDIGQPRVLQLDGTSLTVEVEGNVPHIGLHLAEGEGEVMEVRVRSSDGVVRGELHEVVSVEGDNVGEKVGALHGKVLDDEIHGVVGVLDARNGLHIKVVRSVLILQPHERGNLRCIQHG